MSVVDGQAYPHLTTLTQAVLAQWPEHQRYLDKSLASRDDALLDHSERLSGMICSLADHLDGGLPALAKDYRFLCEDIVLPEEWHFRRTGRYRLTSFEEAFESVYSNGPFMARYMNGLLLSDVLWANHCRAFQHFAEHFLPRLPENASLLEIGPGHGLLLYLATRSPKVGKVTGWDVSATSLASTRQALDHLGVDRPVSLVEQNMFDPSDGLAAEQFDAVVFSEVLEHVQNPDAAMKVLFDVCKPGGHIWVNVPANSPAPDHLLLLTHPDEAAQIIARAGFEVVDTANYPGAGASIERALKHALTISCVVVGRKPATA